MSYILSIAVPTKDRYEYLIQLIDLIKGFNTNEIELVIQDNTEDNKEIVEHIKQLNYPHLKYFHTPQQVSVAFNCDLAILNSTGRYVSLIGDDDGVSAHIVSAVKWMDKMGIEVLKTAFCVYKWPSFSFSRISNLSSTLMVSFYDKHYFKLDPIIQLKDFLKKGGHKFGYLPKVYHGIAKRSTLDKIYVVGETFFPGASPDVANAVALSFVAESFVFLNFPVVIPGNGDRTGGDVQKHKKLRAPISEIAFLPKDTEKAWEKFIPKIWSGETIIPESACKSLRYMGHEEYIEEFLNKDKMLSEFVVAHTDLKATATQLSSNKQKLQYYITVNYFKKYFYGLYNKVLHTLFSYRYHNSFYKWGFFNKNNYIETVNNLKDINEANDYLMKKEPVFLVNDNKIK